MDADDTMGKEGRFGGDGWAIKELWEKYEQVAMHFNDLLIRLRTQALGGVAALSTLVGLFAKTSASVHTSWKIAAVFFLFVCFLWVAVWIIDFCYYNRLLLGAVVALIALEERSKTEMRVRHIDLSTMIERAVARELPRVPTSAWLGVGRWAFYIIVFVVLLAGFAICVFGYLHTDSASQAGTLTPGAL
jgi:hypothetical protein